MNISQLARVKEEGPGPPGVPAASELAARGGQGGVFQATQVARPPGFCKHGDAIRTALRDCEEFPEWRAATRVEALL